MGEEVEGSQGRSGVWGFASWVRRGDFQRRPGSEPGSTSRVGIGIFLSVLLGLKPLTALLGDPEGKRAEGP